MCDAITYQLKGKLVTVNFTDQSAALPVRLKNGRYQLVPWGNKLTEERFPLGGIAHIDQINAGQWDRYQPKPVKISYDAYMQTSIQGEDCWFDNEILGERHLKGLLAFIGQKHRVYVVVQTAELFDADRHDNFPCKAFVPIDRPIK